MKIYLVGLPGSGKTTLGQSLSASLGIPFVDLDEEIERQAGQDIKSIFSEFGETYFRELEAACLTRWSRKQIDFVMSTGGGAPCFFDNMEVMNKAGRTVFLDVPADEIALRLSRMERSERPLIATVAGEDLQAHIESMRTRRLSFYQLSQITLSGKEITERELRQRVSD